MLLAMQPRRNVPLAFENALWWNCLTEHAVPPGFTYTRNSGRLQWDVAAGQYKTVAANTYAPDYDPMTGLCRGFRSETAATNLLLWSADFSNAAWAVTNASKGAANSLIAGGTAQSITQTGAGGYVAQDVGTFTGAAHTAQILVEQGAGAVVTRLLMRNTTDSADVGYADLTWATGAVAASGSGTARAFKRRNTGPNGGAVYMIALSGFIGTSGKNRQVRIIPDATASNAVVYAHHAQLVSGTRVSSPIVTLGASAARQADLMSMLTLPAWFDQSKYVMFAEVELEQESDALSYIIAVAGSSNAELAFFFFANTSAPTLYVYDNSVLTGSSSLPAATAGTSKIASSVAQDSFRLARNGIGATEDTSGAIPTVDRVLVGTAISGTGQLNGWIRRIGIAPRTMTTAELQALTS